MERIACTGQQRMHMTLHRTAVKRTSCRVHRLLGTGEDPTSLTSLFWRWLTGLFGLYGSTLLIGTLSSLPPLYQPPPNPCRVRVAPPPSHLPLSHRYHVTTHRHNSPWSGLPCCPPFLCNPPPPPPTVPNNST